MPVPLCAMCKLFVLEDPSLYSYSPVYAHCLYQPVGLDQYESIRHMAEEITGTAPDARVLTTYYCGKQTSPYPAANQWLLWLVCLHCIKFGGWCSYCSICAHTCFRTQWLFGSSWEFWGIPESANLSTSTYTNFLYKVQGGDTIPHQTWF